MNLSSRVKYCLYSLGLLIAGIAIGVLFSMRFSREMIFRPPQLEDLTRHIEHRLVSRLKLTPEQTQKIHPMLEGYARIFQEIHRDTMNKIDDIITRAEKEISLELTPEQRGRLEEMSRERDLYQQSVNPPPGRAR